MKLKEMENTGVIIKTEEEFDEFKKICIDGGWNNSASKGWLSEEDFDFYLMCGRYTSWGKASNPNGNKLITLAEFKKEQGIMKYSAGDVLEYSEGTGRYLTVRGDICGVYVMTDQIGDPFLYSDDELERKGFTLKTETTKTDMSVSEIEKALGKAAGSLNVVAE